ncbi:hypothetical protein M422DRAFT_273510 [Sphaerobolus stellatus SS14]|uniref:Uncharacterized protein n=1 Tax=Sphaerobolus stellatus (strain SS14) TaxID=990650 RepID=A0A0C9UJF0_SPHS4|nr:hypothetical protein M422DRAFT_273510 [Sphaerobolus stellatus SS14]
MMTSLFSALVATAVLVGVQAQIVVPSPGNVIQIQPTFRGAFPRTPLLPLSSVDFNSRRPFQA